jgi:HAD superfamily hydrolase (TIGR01549 family)
MSKYKAAIFDLDGTLADTRLDFIKMREDLGFPSGVSILEHLETLGPELQESANNIILEHEMKGAIDSTLTKGAFELLSHLKSLNIPMAIQTRNCDEVTFKIIEKLSIPIDLVLTRENSAPKPLPDGVYEIAKEWNISPNQILYVGDSHYDKETSENANTGFALFKNPYNESKKIQHSLSVECLSELIQYF